MIRLDRGREAIAAEKLYARSKGWPAGNFVLVLLDKIRNFLHSINFPQRFLYPSAW